MSQNSKFWIIYMIFTVLFFVVNLVHEFSQRKEMTNQEATLVEMGLCPIGVRMFDPSWTGQTYLPCPKTNN